MFGKDNNSSHILPAPFQKGTESNKKANAIFGGISLVAGILMGLYQAFKGLEEVDEIGTKFRKK